VISDAHWTPPAPADAALAGWRDAAAARHSPDGEGNPTNVAGLPTDMGHSGAQGFFGHRRMRWRYRGSRTPAASSSARPTCRSGSATGRATTRSTVRPTIPMISAARPAALPADRPRRSRPVYGPLSLGFGSRRLAARAGFSLRRLCAQANPGTGADAAATRRHKCRHYPWTTTCW